MNFSTKFFIAALATTAAFPVLAQRLPVGSSSSTTTTTNKKAPDGALPQENATTTTTTTAATSTDGKKYVYSKEAGDRCQCRHCALLAAVADHQGVIRADK